MFVIRAVVAPGGAGALACLAIGLTLAVLVAQFANVSGGMFNPAVALAVYLRGKVTGAKALLAIVGEMGGGLVGGMLAVYLNRTDTPAPVCPGAGAGYSSWDVALAEGVATFFLCLTVLNMATSSKTAGNSTGACGLMIGLSVTAGAYAIGHVSGGSLNPAVTFGLCGSAGEWGGAQWYAYLLPQLVGAVAAVKVYVLAHLNSREDYSDVKMMKSYATMMPAMLREEAEVGRCRA